MGVKRFLLGCLAVFSLMVVAGCGSKLGFCDFEGVVTWKGEVVPGVAMELKPVGHDIRSSVAVTNAEGAFQAECTATQKGVIRGENDVTFSFDPSGDMWDGGNSKQSPGLAKAVAAYSKEHGPIRIEVKGTNREYRFELPIAE